MRMVEAGTSRRRMNITSKPQSEMPMQICMRMQLLCGCRVEADVLPTLQGTKYPDDFPRTLYIGGITTLRPSSYLQDRVFFNSFLTHF